MSSGISVWVSSGVFLWVSSGVFLWVSSGGLIWVSSGVLIKVSSGAFLWVSSGVLLSSTNYASILYIIKFNLFYSKISTLKCTKYFPAQKYYRLGLGGGSTATTRA